jgi:outer membrane protein insertion porin family
MDTAAEARPPSDRYYLGGEDEVRGFNIWSVSPIAFIPDVVSIGVLNADGTQRVTPTILNGVTTFTPVTQDVPIYRPIALGGDTKVVANAEYRAALKGPFTLVFFADAGLNRIVFADQLLLDTGFLSLLECDFPSSGFEKKLPIAPGLREARVSTGAELRVRLPKIGGPIRLYWAWNPLAYNQDILAPRD